MSDRVTCGECGANYDSDVDAFCPRCGSLARGQALPGAVDVARRNDPARRRVQASGAVLALIGALFLLSSLAGLFVPVGELARTFVEPMADQPGGDLVLLPPADGQPFDANVTTLGGEPVANATGHAGPLDVASPKHASLHVAVRWGANATEFDAVALPGDTVRVAVDGPKDGGVAISGTLRTTVAVGRVVFAVLAALLLAGGVSAILLRMFPLAAAAAMLGVLLGLLALVGFPLLGLLFALPFGITAYFILRGRRHFARKAA